MLMRNYFERELATMRADHRRRCTGSGRAGGPGSSALSFFLVTTRRLYGHPAAQFRAVSLSRRLAPGPEQRRGRNVDPFEAAVDPLEMRRDEVAHLGAELIDQEGAALADRPAVASPIASPTPGGRVEKGRPDRT